MRQRESDDLTRTVHFMARGFMPLGQPEVLRYCPRCSGLVSEADELCPHCGQTREAVDAPAPESKP